MGIGTPFLSSLALNACSKTEEIFPDIDKNFNGNILIVGAGAAGLAAGYLLNQQKINFQIVEAAPNFGGRLKRAENFVDFPIDLGAEWIHTHPSILSEIVNDQTNTSEIEIIVYNPKTIQTYQNNKLRSHNYINKIYSEWKFKNSTWFGFFEQNIVPQIQNQINYNCAVSQINYSGNKVEVTCKNNQQFLADKVLITVPLKILQNRSIAFLPDLPTEKQQAINNITMGDGIKIFIEFKERFYPDFLAFGNIIAALNNEEKFVYDAAFGKSTNRNVLALFAINQKAKAYTDLMTDEKIISHFLAELDKIFDGKASKNYIKHIIQNWSAEPYIQGAYSYAFNGKQKEIVNSVLDPINNKIYFAGEALSIEHQAMVHGACQSGFDAVKTMIEN